MCGIFGHAGSNPKKINIDKLNVLGIWNEDRGTDSCGLTMDGDLLKGVKTLAQYRDFIAHYGIEGPQVVPTVIGHTRKSTVGAHTLSNAHPFGFGKLKLKEFKDPGFEFVGVHNGTLVNHKELATKRGISLEKKIKVKVKTDEVGEDTFKIEETTVSKIDSELLLECLYKDGDFSVLGEYIGAAALIWTNLNKPNVVYYWHGKSLKVEGDKDAEEERPLYWWKQAQNSLYVSSIADSLYAIGGDGDTVDMFDHNTVYEVTNGNIKTAKKTVIDRSKMYQRESYFSRSGFHNRTPSYQNSRVRDFHGATTPSRKRTTGGTPGILGKTYYPKIGSAEQLQLNLEIPVDTGLIYEQFDLEQSVAKGITQMKQLRYFRNGHRAEGVFGYVAGYGFYFLGHTKANAAKTLKQWAGKPFHKGTFKTDDISALSNDAFIPFPTKFVENNVSSFLHYMHSGIRYKTHLDWKNVIDDSANAKRFSVIELSMCSSHPIIDLGDVSRDNKINGVYYKGELYSGEINPLGTNKKYKFRFGQLQSISYIPGFVPEALTNAYTPIYSLDNAAAFLKKSAEIDADSEEGTLVGCCSVVPDTKTEKEIKDKKKVDNLNEIINELESEEEDQLNQVIIENFHENFEKFPETLRVLRKLKKNSKKAEIAYETIQGFLSGCSKLVAHDIDVEIQAKKKQKNK